MPRIKEKTVYAFQELEGSARENALQKLWDINVNSDWWDFILDDFKTECEFFEVGQIYFSGFAHQGSGAMFEYDGLKAALIDEFAATLTKRERLIFENCTTGGRGKHTGRYYSCEHSIYLEFEDWYDYPNCAKMAEGIEADFVEFVEDKYNDLAHELYKTLEKEYDYLTSEEVIIGTIEANEYEFDEYGNLD